MTVRDQSGLFALSVPSAKVTGDGVVIEEERINAQSTECVIRGQIHSTDSALNELVLRYKVKGEQEDSLLLYDAKSRTFCHIINDILSNASRPKEAPHSEGGAADELKLDLDANVLIPRRVVFVIDRSGSMSGLVCLLSADSL